MQQMCALLKDGHSEVFLPKELAERMEADLPLRIDLIENRVFVTGEPTGGSTGDPLAFALPGGGSGRVATSADVGAGLVGRGVQPDVLTPRTAEDFLAGRDAALAAGIAELRSGTGR